MSETEHIRNRYLASFFPNYAPYALIPAHGKGSKLWDVEGKEYIDFAGGIAVNALGHCHPELVAVLREQSEKLWHMSNYFISGPAVELADRLTKSTFADAVFFSNSGSEANETALKLARKYAVQKNPQKYQIVSALNSFHGRSLFTVSVGGRKAYTDGFGPLPGGITHIPFNDCSALEHAVNEATCAVIVEPIQGEGGVIPADAAFLQKAAELCKRFGALLLFDEVQCGVGRTGSLFAYMHYGITPDILTTAKALGCGIPVSATLTTREIAHVFMPGSHGSTFGGNPLACAVADKVMEIISRPGFLAEVKEKDAYLTGRLLPVITKYAIADSIRGIGLLKGIPLKEAFKNDCKELCRICVSQGLLVLEAANGTLRLAPALNISAAEIDEGIRRLGVALERFTKT